MERKPEVPASNRDEALFHFVKPSGAKRSMKITLCPRALGTGNPPTLGQGCKSVGAERKQEGDSLKQ